MQTQTISPSTHLKITEQATAAAKDLSVLADVAPVLESALAVGEKIGQGGFAEIRAVNLSSQTAGSDKYVLKRLRSDLNKGDPSRAIADLVIEAALLSAVEHQHIVGI
jgi:hypothetical protein